MEYFEKKAKESRIVPKNVNEEYIKEFIKKYLPDCELRIMETEYGGKLFCYAKKRQ